MRRCCVRWFSDGSLFSAPSQKGKRLDDMHGFSRVEVLGQQFLDWLHLYNPNTRLPVVTRSGRPGRFPLLGVSSLVAVNVGVFWLYDQAVVDPKTLLSWVWLDVPGLRSMWSAGELSLRPLCSLFSHAFFHPEWQTLVPNMAALFMFGHRTWRSVGWGGMTALYLSGGIVSGIILAIEGSRTCVGASPSVFAIAVVSAILLGKDTLRLRVIHLPVSVVVAGYAGVMALQASALETVPTLVGGGLAGLVCLWLLRARAKRACPVASGALAERHVSRAALASLSSQASVDLSYARAPSASWWRRHRGVFVLSELPLARIESLVLDGATLDRKLDLSTLPPSLRVLQCRHAAVVLTGFPPPTLKTLRLSGKSARVDSPQFGEWLERATRTLEELELHLAPSSCAEREATVRVAGRSPLRRLSLDGPLVRLHLPSHCELRALHLGPGAHLASPPVSELALAALGLAEASSVPARFPATLVSLYLDASAWSEDVFVPTLPPTLRELVLVGASASLLSKLFQSCQSFPASIRLIDCAELRVKLPSSVQLSIETSSFDVMPAFVSWFRSSKKSTQK